MGLDITAVLRLGADMTATPLTPKRSPLALHEAIFWILMNTLVQTGTGLLLGKFGLRLTWKQGAVLGMVATLFVATIGACIQYSRKKEEEIIYFKVGGYLTAALVAKHWWGLRNNFAHVVAFAAALDAVGQAPQLVLSKLKS